MLTYLEGLISIAAGPAVSASEIAGTAFISSVCSLGRCWGCERLLVYSRRPRIGGRLGGRGERGERGQSSRGRRGDQNRTRQAVNRGCNLGLARGRRDARCSSSG